VDWIHLILYIGSFYLRLVFVFFNPSDVPSVTILNSELRFLIFMFVLLDKFSSDYTTYGVQNVTLPSKPCPV
jgi:hypothetical protein